MTDECPGKRHGYDRFPRNIGWMRSCGVWHCISALICRLPVTAKRFDGPARRELRQPLTVHDRARISGTVFREAGEPIKQANRSAGELRLRNPSVADHPVCWSAKGQSLRAEAAQ
jgi:hypothetical protein